MLHIDVKHVEAAVGGNDHDLGAAAAHGDDAAELLAAGGDGGAGARGGGCVLRDLDVREVAQRLPHLGYGLRQVVADDARDAAAHELG